MFAAIESYVEKYLIAILLSLMVALILAVGVQWSQKEKLVVDLANRDTIIAQKVADITLLTNKVTQQSDAIAAQNKSIADLGVRLATLTQAVDDSQRQAAATRVKTAAVLDRLKKATVPPDYAGAAAWGQTQIDSLLEDWTPQ